MLDTQLYESRRHAPETKKGVLTKALILQAALEIAGKSGLEALTIGTIAETVNMSKSGVFAHFGSREELQVAVIHEYYKRFREVVFGPALLQPKGLPRLRSMIDAWSKISVGENTSGCFFIGGAAEFDDRPGIVRDELIKSVEDWRTALLRAIKEAISMGDLKKTVDPKVLLFQLYSTVLGVHHDARFLKNPKSISIARNLTNSILASHQTVKR